MGTRSTASTTVKVEVACTIKNTLTDGQIASAAIGTTYLTESLANGVDASQVNRGWESRSRSLLTGVAEDIDLYDFGVIDIGAGAGKDAVGQAIIMEEVVLFLVRHVSGTGRLEINPTIPTGKATWIPTMTVANGGALKAGGALLLYQEDAGAFDIQDGVSHTVKFKANGGAVVYDIIVLGRHDDNESSSSSKSSSTLSTKTSSSGSSLTSTSTSKSSSSHSVSSLSSSTQSATTTSVSSSTQSATTTSVSTLSTKSSTSSNSSTSSKSTSSTQSLTTTSESTLSSSSKSSSSTLSTASSSTSSTQSATTTSI